MAEAIPGDGGALRQFRQERQYEAVRRAAEEEKYSVTEACRALCISRTGCCQWRSGRASACTVENGRLAGLVKKIHNESPDKGCQRIWDDLARYYGAPVNDKRTLRICRSPGVLSTIKYSARLSPASLRSAVSGGKRAEPPVLRRKAQREVADGCNRVQI